jgi:thimet oligopeptidase
MILTSLTLSLALLAPPTAVDVPPLRHKWTPGEIAAACEKAEKDTDAKLAALVAVPDAKRTFKESFESFDRILAEYGETVARLSFMKDIHPDGAVRDAGSACEERAGKYSVALSARKDLYLAMKGWLANAGAAAGAMDKLDAEQKRLVELTMLDFKKNGLELNDADRAKLVELRSKLTDLQTKFQKNLNEDKSFITVTKKEDLAGLPDDFIAAHEDPKKKGTYIITTKYPDYYPVMENCTKESTRRALQVAFMNKGGPENLKLLDEAVALRAQAAKLLGYKVHADVVAEDRMAKNSATIAAFLGRMRKGLAPALESDTKKMQDIKQKGAKPAINSWDWRFYMNEIKKRDFAIDDEAVRAYFPSDKVLNGMFEVYAKTFGLTIKDISTKDVWADGVKLYEIRDSESKRLIGKFYADFYPRDGKYGHAAEFTLSSGRSVDGGYRIPMAALVVNFQPPKDGKAALLSMDEVDTLFHEFGHVVHELLTTARYAQQSGTRTALDFVEAPSQMLENWAYHPEVLPMISSGMPADLAAKLNAARKYNAGVHYSRQLFLGSFDQAIHTVDKTNADLTAKKLWSEIMKFPEDPKEHFAGTFGHMMGGYDGGYYGYLWSEVFAADMFTRFAAEGVLNPKTGREYRDRVLARGRTVEPSVLLKDFLGREPNEEAFLKLLGIGAAPAPKK